MRGGRILILLALVLIALVVLAALFLPQLLSPAGMPGGQVATSSVTQIPEIRVYAVAQYIPRGTLIDESLVTQVIMPQNLVVPGMFTDFEQIRGRKAKFDLEPGLILHSSMLANVGDILSATGSDWALAIPAGKVAISLPISRLSSVSYAPRPGDHVDIIGSMLIVDLDSDFQTKLPNKTADGVYPPNPVAYEGNYEKNEVSDQTQTTNTEDMKLKTVGETSNLVGTIMGPSMGRVEIDPVLGHPFYVMPNESEGQRPRLVSQMLLQNVIVLRVGNFPTEEEEAQKAAAVPAAGTQAGGAVVVQGTPVPPTAPPPSAGGAQPTPVMLQPPDVITLIVSPQDATGLIYLMYRGVELTLALRSAGDETIYPVESVTQQFIFDHYNITIPVKLPYGIEPRLDELQPPVLQNDLVLTPFP